MTEIDNYAPNCILHAHLTSREIMDEIREFSAAVHEGRVVVLGPGKVPRGGVGIDLGDYHEPQPVALAICEPKALHPLGIPLWGERALVVALGQEPAFFPNMEAFVLSLRGLKIRAWIGGHATQVRVADVIQEGETNGP